MTQKPPSALPDHLFLVDVQDPDSGTTITTLRPERSPVMLLSFAANHFTEAASRHFKSTLELGAVDWRLLFVFAHTPGGTAASASRTIGVDKGAVSRSLQRLEDLGLVAPGELHANGRSRGWSLTRQGQRVHGRVLRVALARQKDVLTGFVEAEVMAFCSYLDRFLHNLESMLAEEAAEAAAGTGRRVSSRLSRQSPTAPRA
jgi:DNA-binding MarR family transcriptional regulator